MAATLLATRQYLPYDIASRTGTYGPTRMAGTEVILGDASGGAVTVNLPASSGNKAMFVIKKIDSSANTVTVDGNSTETIDGSTTAVLRRQYESITLVCDGSNWHII